ncbi:hypothetical protein Cpin_3300 [Chitinophaga pinensis DSM 2588]|uniref:Uncharacterized protein n=1 Tax=Chitinophaga pinensis (strain ATCC 43595 / DSM 2588 / LMG 13176 / NBRC 15968 / NCIMB 11800 / UQM 2034) TaxID=485918 RepID=A0A979G4Z6_CHIPD|nr:hypothetical protein Cpin_3300 [Chitinophaga pinensis DSM 2588]
MTTNHETAAVKATVNKKEAIRHMVGSLTSALTLLV